MNSLAAALARWQHAAGAYWPYVCAVPFLSDEVVPSPTRPRRTPAGGWLVRLIQEVPADTHPAIFVDLPPTQTLPATPELVRAGFVVVPVIQRWVSVSAVLDGRSLVNHLAHFSRTLRRPSPERGVIFLLDGDRQGPIVPGVAAARALDNRYRYSRDRFPPARFLQARGIDAIASIGRADLADDVREYLDELREGLPAGLRRVALAEPARAGAG